MIGSRLALLLPLAVSAGPLKPLPHPSSEDISLARRLQQSRPFATPSEIASHTRIGDNYKDLIAWMRDDLRHYLDNFDSIFDAKLERIERHQRQRTADLLVHTADVRKSLEQNPEDLSLKSELARLVEIHKPQAFAETYRGAKDFADKYIGPRGKLLRSELTEAEIQRMNMPGEKKLYVDTWAVPFFNTGTQTRAQAKDGVRQALEMFDSIDPKADVSLLDFTRYIAIFARPEFDDVRRFKLLPFPSDIESKRFAMERSDAKTFGQKFPEEGLVVINKGVDLGPVSFIFGQKLSIFGLITHSTSDNSADGRVFTGPADFLEHDYAHAFFILTPAIPGNAAEWEAVHREFMVMRDAATDPKLRLMMRLVYYHFTHESGFRALDADINGKVDLAKFQNERKIIEELIHTRYHYDFIINGDRFPDGYTTYLDTAFEKVGGFFKDHFLRIQAVEYKTKHACFDLVGRVRSTGE